MVPWSVKFFHNLANDTWRFEATHDNGQLISKSQDVYNSFEAVYAATKAFNTPTDPPFDHGIVQSWIADRISIENEQFELTL